MTSYRLERDLLTGKLEVPATLLPAEEPAPAWQTSLGVLRSTPAGSPGR